MRQCAGGCHSHRHRRSPRGLERGHVRIVRQTRRDPGRCSGPCQASRDACAPLHGRGGSAHVSLRGARACKPLLSQTACAPSESTQSSAAAVGGTLTAAAHQSPWPSRYSSACAPRRLGLWATAQAGTACARRAGTWSRVRAGSGGRLAMRPQLLQRAAVAVQPHRRLRRRHRQQRMGNY